MWVRHFSVAILAWYVLAPGAPPTVADEKAKAPAASLRDSFETAQIVWEQEHTDAAVNLIAQDRSVRAAHDGNLSEHFQFESELGSQFFVSYALPRIPVTEDLQAALYVRADRVGVQLFARVVLPEDIDPETRARSFVLIPGTIYDRLDRWQRLELSHMLPSIERQARVLRASTRRPVSIKGAYLERFVVNLMGGAGASEVYLDDLSVTPVPSEILAAWTRERGEARGKPPGAGASRPGPGGVKPALVRLNRNRLSRLGDDRRYHDWLPTAIDAPGADVADLRRYGFDLLVDDRKGDPERIKQAIEKGFLLMPRLQTAREQGAAGEVLKEVSEYPFKESVALWQIGEGLGRKRDSKQRDEELKRVREIVSAMRQMPGDFSRITTATVEGDLPLYARAPANLDTIGIQPLLWGSGQDPLESFEYLKQRRRLTARANLGALFWCWIPAVAPASARLNIWGTDVPPAWGVPQVTPEQLRLMTYQALSAGYRGLGFLGDADLSRPAGRMLLIEMAFLNEEIDLLESVLARSADPIPIYRLYDPPPPDLPPPGALPNTRVRIRKELPPRDHLYAASVSVERKGALLLVSSFSPNAQYQPPQMAARNLVIRAAMPESAQAFEISPGEVRLLERNRAPGGTEITLDEFSTTAMILCTTDLALKDRVEAALARVRPLAVQLAIEQAELMLQSVTEIIGRLTADGQGLVSEQEMKQRVQAGIRSRPTDERDLLALAAASIKAARELQEREDFGPAWAEARRASRPLRTLMFGHSRKAFGEFGKAVAESQEKPQDPTARPIPLLLKPVCCPPCIAFNTLPEAYLWIDWARGRPGYRFGSNRVPSGSFDDPGSMPRDGWINLDYQVAGLSARMATVPSEVDPSNRLIRMSVEPNRPEDLDKNAPFLDFPVAAVRSPAIKVQASNLIRVSLLVRRPIASAVGMGGIIVRDSIGGEQFQYRTSDPIPAWSRVVIYRKAPEDGTFTVTFGLAGYGEADFDDFRVELIEADEGPRTEKRPDLADQARPRRSPGQPQAPGPPVPAATAGTTLRRR